MPNTKLKYKTTKLVFDDQLYEVDLVKACELIKQKSGDNAIDFSNLGEIITYLFNNQLFSHDFLTPLSDDQYDEEEDDDEEYDYKNNTTNKTQSNYQ